MINSLDNRVELLYIKNMVCNCCKIFLKEKFEDLGLTVKEISLGKVRIVQPEKKISHEEINALLKHYGFELAHNREDRIVDEIKTKLSIPLQSFF